MPRRCDAAVLSSFTPAPFAMIAALLLQAVLGFGGGVRSQFNSPSGVDIWCGKAYRETNSSFDPGGWLYPPNATTPPDQLKLDLRIYPRYNFYLASESKGSFILDTPVSFTKGLAYKNETFDDDAPLHKKPFTELIIQIRNQQTNAILVGWTRISVNASDVEVNFDLRNMTAGVNAEKTWSIYVIGKSPDATQTYTAGTTLTVLPQRNGTGSVTRIDKMYGGIEVKSNLTQNEWKPILPYGFYTSWDWISSTINNASATKNLTTLRNSGYNLIHPVPPGGSDPFNYTLFSQFLTICDDLELYVMYDMRHTYKNNTSITRQLPILQDHPSLLLYYTADEPDGWCDPLNATKLAYDHIRSLDPYHPVSLVLNCGNFYFAEYTSGADVVLEDTYPIAVNTSFSNVYNTVCNTTYGDCGCDNCHANDPEFPAYVHNPFLDIIDRTENLYAYQEWSGDTQAMRKPVWGVPQGFYDQGSFWTRWPTGKEEVLMGMLRVNHGAKGVVAWIYPTSDDIEAYTSALSKVVTGEAVASFLLGTKRMILGAVGGGGLVDATAWFRGGEILVSVVFMGYESPQGRVEVVLPKIVEGIETLWGPGGWIAEGKGIVKEQVEGLEVSILKGKVVA